MNFGLFTDPDRTRLCGGLRLRLLKEATKDQAILAAVAQELEVPGAQETVKLAAIEQRIEELRKSESSLWFDVPEAEVLAASIYKARARAPQPIEALFRQAPKAQALVAPLVEWIMLAGMNPYAGAAISVGQPYVVGCRDGSFISGERLVGFAPVNDALAIERAFDDLRPLREQMHAMYLVGTPAVVAEYLWAQATAPRARRWDAEALNRKLKERGIGLLVVEGDAIAQALLPTERRPPKARLTDLAAKLQAQGPIRSV
ncbi:MAG TPA: hypothetical protein VHG72_03420 [Polyangia bacterium]|nr:hypothetical protein [Polyangia bacterium]